MRNTFAKLQPAIRLNERWQVQRDAMLNNFILNVLWEGIYILNRMQFVCLLTQIDNIQLWILNKKTFLYVSTGCRKLRRLLFSCTPVSLCLVTYTMTENPCSRLKNGRSVHRTVRQHINICKAIWLSILACFYSLM